MIDGLSFRSALKAICIHGILLLPDERIAALTSPDQERALRAGKLLEDLPALCEKATLGERRTLLLTMLDAVYVDAKDEKRVVAINPKPAFKSLFCMATMREGSEVVLVSREPKRDKEKSLLEDKSAPPDDSSEGSVAPCVW